MRRGYADIPEGQLHYRHAGNGKEIVILLHMSGSSSEEYEDVGNILAKQGYQAFAIDLLGFGSSDTPSHYYYSMDDHIVSVLSFMDKMGIERAHLCGNMATANMAARMGVSHPERVKGLLLCHPLYNPDPDYFKRRGHTPACGDGLPSMAMLSQFLIGVALTSLRPASGGKHCTGHFTMTTLLEPIWTNSG